MSIIIDDFPFEEIRLGENDTPVINDGDYFHSIDQAMRVTRKSRMHVWSVTEHEGTWVYGPSHHYVNLIGYVVTDQPHDNDTYYEEALPDVDFED